MKIKSHKGGRDQQLHARLTRAEKDAFMKRVRKDGFKSVSDWIVENIKMAKIIMQDKELEFPTVEAAEKYAAFDETTWPCDVVDDEGNIISHWGDNA